MCLDRMTPITLRFHFTISGLTWICFTDNIQEVLIEIKLNVNRSLDTVDIIIGLQTITADPVRRQVEDVSPDGDIIDWTKSLCEKQWRRYMENKGNFRPISSSILWSVFVDCHHSKKNSLEGIVQKENDNIQSTFTLKQEYAALWEQQKETRLEDLSITKVSVHPELNQLK